MLAHMLHGVVVVVVVVGVGVVVVVDKLDSTQLQLARVFAQMNHHSLDQLLELG